MSILQQQISGWLRRGIGVIVLLACSHVAYAQSEDNFDDITIRVIGLDEVPKTTMQVIEFPEPDLGEMNDIREGVSSGRAGLTHETGEIAGVGASPPSDGAAADTGAGANTGAGGAGGAPTGTADTAQPAPANQ
jgi:hypothetical protein